MLLKLLLASVAYSKFVLFGIVVLASSSLAALDAKANEPGVAMMVCHGIRDDGILETETSWMAVMEQTNPDEFDGSVVLDPETFSGKPVYFLLKFRVRIFEDVEDYLIDGTMEEIAIHLLSDEIPPFAYSEVRDAEAVVAFNALRVRWNWNILTGDFDTMLNYQPSRKSEEEFVDLTTFDSRVVWCDPPFLKSKID